MLSTLAACLLALGAPDSVSQRAAWANLDHLAPKKVKGTKPWTLRFGLDSGNFLALLVVRTHFLYLTGKLTFGIDPGRGRIMWKTSSLFQGQDGHYPGWPVQAVRVGNVAVLFCSARPRNAKA